jgi:hypothetical protein
MNRYPLLADGIDINQVEDGYVIYQQAKDRVHYLNHTAALVLEGCTGKNSVDDIVRIVQDGFDLPDSPVSDVNACLESLAREGIIL